MKNTRSVPKGCPYHTLARTGATVQGSTLLYLSYSIHPALAVGNLPTICQPLTSLDSQGSDEMALRHIAKV